MFRLSVLSHLRVSADHSCQCETSIRYAKLLRVLAEYVFDNTTTSISHGLYTVDANDTSVISITEGASVRLSYVDILKYGFSTNLLTASFYGFNAAVHVVRVFFQSDFLLLGQNHVQLTMETIRQTRQLLI